MGQTRGDETLPVSHDVEPSPSHNPRKRPAPRGSASYARKRAVTACQVCRARRTKCDNLKPSCSFCLKVGAKCIQSSVDFSSFDTASLQILQRLDDLEALVRKTHNVDGTAEHDDSTYSDPEESIDKSWLLPRPIDQILEWEVLRGLRAQHQPEGPTYPHANSSTTHMTASPPTFGFEELEPHRIKILLDNFFNHVHVKNPVLDEQHTRNVVLKVCMHGIDWSPDACLALLVCALGTIATPLHNEYISRESDAYRTAGSFFLAAKKRLGILLAESSLQEAQCLFLAGVYSMHTFARLPAWRYFMQSLACSQTFDSLKTVKQDYGALDEAQRRVVAAEQAIYWSAWKSEREVHDELWMPGHKTAEFSIECYPPFFPTPPIHERSALATTTAAMEEREQSSWYFYLSEISLLRLRRRLASEIAEFKPPSGDGFLEALAKGVPDHLQEIGNWAVALPHQVSIASPPEEDGICQFVLRGHLIDVYEMLYWPYVEAAIRPNLPSFTPAAVQDLATKGLQVHVDRIRVNRRGFRHRHHGTFSMIKACTRSALILLAAAASLATGVSGQTRQSYHLPPEWESAVEEVIQLNQDWQHEAQDLAKIVVVLEELWHNWQLLSRGPLGL
ncbi:hypothetical protein DM02DRAFT_646404 [Periconia macrospinosa]|uniref:Zn(2)-C6 fungal-type domain-containing protein n=1 Tax=Periconia macrospinosa TaxID=97972 RepID=A0A2V1D8L7_9PLEO|nr:hypothetical protein DM02DRAFT_646404 [Periconia macrospinosa]